MKKKIDLSNYVVYEMKKEALSEIYGGGVFEYFGMFMGALLYENQKLATENPSYLSMVNSFSH